MLFSALANTCSPSADSSQHNIRWGGEAGLNVISSEPRAPLGAMHPLACPASALPSLGCPRCSQGRWLVYWLAGNRAGSPGLAPRSHLPPCHGTLLTLVTDPIALGSFKTVSSFGGDRERRGPAGAICLWSISHRGQETTLSCDNVLRMSPSCAQLFHLVSFQGTLPKSFCLILGMFASWSLSWYLLWEGTTETPPKSYILKIKLWKVKS